MKNQSWIFAILVFSLVRAFYTPVFKYLTGFLHPFTLLFYAMIISVVFFFILIKGKVKKFKKLKLYEKKYLIFMYFIVTMGALLIDLSFLYLTVKSIAILISLLPIFVAILSIFILKEKPTKLLWVSIVFAFAGSVIFKSVNNFQIGLGDIILLIGIILFALSPIVQRKYVKKIGQKEMLFLFSMIKLSVLFFVVYFTGNLIYFPMDLNLILIFLVFVFVITIGTNFLAASLFKKISAPLFSTITTALIPIGAIIIGIQFLGETIAMTEIIGGAILIGAAILAVRSTK